MPDRESDFYPMLARVPEGVDLVVRCRHDRKLATSGEISGASASWEQFGEAGVWVPPRHPGDKGRTARVVIRGGPITIMKPVGKVRTDDPPQLNLGLVDVEERNAPTGVLLRCSGDC